MQGFLRCSYLYLKHLFILWHILHEKIFINKTLSICSIFVVLKEEY